MINEFTEVFHKRFDLLQDLKAQGKRIIGWSCTYVPEEVIHAAGILPIRVLGGVDATPVAEAYFYANTCSFVRNCAELGFRGYYDFLDGFVATNACDHIRRLYDIWSHYMNTPFNFVFQVPSKISDTSIDFYRRELTRFKQGIEEAFGVKITDESLRHSIEVHNHMRRLLKDLYALRKDDIPPITGAETLEVILAGLSMPKETFSQMLNRLLACLPYQRSSSNKEEVIR